MIDYTSGTDDNVVADDTDCNEKSGAKFLPSLRSIIAAFLAGNARCSKIFATSATFLWSAEGRWQNQPLAATTLSCINSGDDC